MMFWKYGGYASVSAVETILDKPDFTIEDLLDEGDLIQELKQHNSKLLDYLRRRDVLQKLLDYAVAPQLEPVAVPDRGSRDDDDQARTPAFFFSRPRASSRPLDNMNEEEEAEKRRNKYAFVASEILAFDTWSICEAILDPENRDLLFNFWKFLKRPVPLDPLQASYFTKVNESLFDKKTDEMIEFLKSVENALSDMLRHVDSPMVMDLLLKIISLERTESGQGIVEWLYTQEVMPSLLSFLGPEHSWATQTSAGDFMKAIITVSANASQNEQTCIGPNELTRQLVSKPCVEQLIKYMLAGGNALTVGVGIVIEVIRKNNSDYDPDVGAEANSMPSSRDPIYLGTLLRLFADNVPNFMNLIMKGQTPESQLESTFGGKIQRLGFDRFKTCELMAELLHCSNMGLLNEVGSEDLIAARDAERHRLRMEGRLTAVRGEEAPSSVEDLTMRIPTSSPADEGRRLEVTNISDDDGFEEVTNVVEMAEDTSHEFVKAEEEIPQALPPSSFLDKDEDDFVDEPLSSPRLNVSDSKVEESQFDEPDLVVPPLSPKKQTSVTSSPEIADSNVVDHPKVEAAIEEIQGLVLETKHEVESVSDHSIERDSKPTTVSSSEGSGSPLLTPTSSSIYGTEAAPSERPSTLDVNQSTQPNIAASVEPQPEDMPAPLFSNLPKKAETQEPDSNAPLSTEPNAGTSLETNIKAQSMQQAVKESEQAEKEGATQGETPAATQEQESGEASIIVSHRPEVEAEMASSGVESHIKPVVGDYLKMQFVEYGVVPTILSFFFTYPWNNFLHNVVYDVVQQVFNGPMDRGYNPTLAISLFEAADITAQIINGQIASTESEERNKTRMGYMGHLTLIAEEVVKFNERHPPELLSEIVLEKVMSQEWSNYVEGPLAETRERDNAILGGVRPDVAMHNRVAAQSSGLATIGLSSLGGPSGLGGGGVGGSGSSALAEAGLNGGMDLHENGGSGSLSQFAISSGTTGGMSGFGSSSDEDEDDQEDNDEDVANEFRAYIDPLNSSSLNPPSIPPPPPPPPPLNIPPSRARLQLAARLAMNKRNAAAAAAAAAGGSSDPQENRSSLSAQEGRSNNVSDRHNSGLLHHQSEALAERLRDPFADDEDEDDDVDDVEHLDSSAATGERGTDNASESGGGGWKRGGWWRGVVRSRRSAPGGGSSAAATERFGDGRDDSDDDDDSPVDDDDDDEEFGDFAMPEVSDPPVRASEGAAGAIFDREREKVLLKPLPVHPPSHHSSSMVGGSKFGSLWPFDGLGFGPTTTTTTASLSTGPSSTTSAMAGLIRSGENNSNSAGSSTATVSPAEKSGSTEKQASAETREKAASLAATAPAPSSSISPSEKDVKPPAENAITVVPIVEKNAAIDEETASTTEEETVIVDEDGKKVSRAVEAKRRTSIEDPDDEEVVV